jgi:[acyl-carrier-protein] S-malonyltransferase
MQSAVPVGVGTMAAIIGIKDPDVIDKLCTEAAQGQVLEPSAYNTMGQVVIAGHVEAVDRACDLAKSYRGIAKKLNVSAPFHCSLLAPAGLRLSEALANAAIAPLRVPYVPNVTAEWTQTSTADEIRDRLVRQVSTPVMWQQSMATMVERGVDTWLEVGAGRTLCGLIKRFERKATASGFESESWRN